MVPIGPSGFRGSVSVGKQESVPANMMIATGLIVRWGQRVERETDAGPTASSWRRRMDPQAVTMPRYGRRRKPPVRAAQTGRADTKTRGGRWTRLPLVFHDGRGGIRTHGTLSRTHTFQACALNHSATDPFAIGLTSARRTTNALTAGPPPSALTCTVPVLPLENNHERAG